VFLAKIKRVQELKAVMSLSYTEDEQSVEYEVLFYLENDMFLPIRRCFRKVGSEMGTPALLPKKSSLGH